MNPQSLFLFWVLQHYVAPDRVRVWHVSLSGFQSVVVCREKVVPLNRWLLSLACQHGFQALAAEKRSQIH